MSNPNSPQDKSVKKHARGLLHVIKRLKMPSNRYLAVQKTRNLEQAPFIKTTSKEC